jgi:lipopolysaccharide transport system permease protein
VLQSRFGPDGSRVGFALYFLAGMLPWLPFAEAVGRAPHVMVEHRNFIKKLVFPVEILPVTPVFASLLTGFYALLVFVAGLLIARGTFPVYLPALVLLLAPQVLFTLGMAWFLAALGVFVRDLGQIIGFLLTLWFFLTPICYPEASLPAWAVPILTKNPIYVLVSGYRAVLLENRLPPFHSLWKLWAVSAVVFLLGHAWFHKLRKSFADVI